MNIGLNLDEAFKDNPDALQEAFKMSNYQGNSLQFIAVAEDFVCNQLLKLGIGKPIITYAWHSHWY